MTAMRSIYAAARALPLLFALPASALISTLAAQVVPPGGQPAREITLDDAVRLAQQNAPALVQARGALRSSAAGVKRAYAAFIPNVNTSITSGRSDGATYFQGALVPLRGDAWSFSNSISTNVDLYDGGRRMSEVRRTKAVETAAQASERTQLYNTALNVKQVYFNGLAARELEGAALRQLEQAEQQMAASIARVRAGAATKSDSLRSVIQVGNAKLAVLTARNNLQVANAGLTRLVGSEFVVTPTSADTVAPSAVRLENETLVSMLDQAPALQQAQADLAASRAAVKTARAAWLPSLSASYSFSANQSSGAFEPGNLFLIGGQNPNNKRLNFNISYPLFNQLQRETSIIQAQVTQRNSEATLRDARLATQQTLTQALGTLRLAEERASIQDASVAAAEEDLRVQTQRYQLGAATILDVLTSQTTLIQARVALIQARYDARVAKAQIEALIGQELP